MADRIGLADEIEAMTSLGIRKMQDGERKDAATMASGVADLLFKNIPTILAALRANTDPSLERVEAMRRQAIEAARSVADDFRARAKRMEADAALRDSAGFVDSCANFVDLLSFKIAALPIPNEGAERC